MTIPTGIHRTAKVLLDTGCATTIDDAEAQLRSLSLDVLVGPEIESATAQAALLTVINTASRAFLGGVNVCVERDVRLTVPLYRGRRLSDVVAELGGTSFQDLEHRGITIVIGSPERAPATGAIYPTWSGWCGAVVDDPSVMLDQGDSCELAGILAAGMAVSEAFQHVLGSPVAARRSVGLSLWRPELDWRDDDARGPDLAYLPASYWLLGLGHLGQAFAWAIGLLSHTDDTPVHVMLQDYDRIEVQNWSTSLLTTLQDVDTYKARVVSARLEAAGIRTTICERRFDETTRPSTREPTLVLAGFDRPEPRRLLDQAGFELVVDAGLGAGAAGYLDIMVHQFPGAISSEDAFPASTPALTELPPHYDQLVDQLVLEGTTPEEARCGMLGVAGQAVAASFVGAVAACIVLAEPLRQLHGGSTYDVIELSLRSPQHRAVATGLDKVPTFGHVSR